MISECFSKENNISLAPEFIFKKETKWANLKIKKKHIKWLGQSIINVLLKIYFNVIKIQTIQKKKKQKCCNIIFY